MAYFTTIWIDVISSSGAYWTLIIGGLLILYAYSIQTFGASTQKTVWYCLLATGISALVGASIESLFVAIARQDDKFNKGYAYLLGLNEVNWIIQDSSTIAYAVLKLGVVLERKPKIFLWVLMSLISTSYAGARIYIGIMRVQQATLTSPSIEKAHSFAFLPVGIAEFIITFLIVYAYSYNKDKTVKTILSSSLPRLLIIGINTIFIIVLGFLGYQFSSSDAWNILFSGVWLVKSTYPLILLYDLMSTRYILSESEVIQKKFSGEQQPLNL